MSSGARATLDAFCVFGVAAVLIMSAEWWAGLTITDSIRYNRVWTEQFRDMVREGTLYPRFHLRSWDGLGSPTFYFYPPLFFWIAAALDAASLQLLPLGALVSATTATALAASGCAMWVWLRSKGAEKPIVFAVAYMIAPYHLYDIYVRGALAETLSFAMLPIAALALDWLAKGRRGGIAMLAVACSLLLLAHLPVAFVTIILLLVPYALFLAISAEGAVTFLAKAAVGGLIGLGIAAGYWLPIIWLTPFISVHAFTGPFFMPSNWFFWAPWRWVRSDTLSIIIPLTAAYALVALIALRKTSQSRFWGGLSLGAAAMAGGFIPFFWELPGFTHVQFPYRCLVVVEFATLTAASLAWSTDATVRYPGMAFALFAAWLMPPVVAQRVIGTHQVAQDRLAELSAQHRDAPEYLPRGLSIPIDSELLPDPMMVQLPPAPLTPPATGGPQTIELSPSASGVVVVRRFYYPLWRVTDAEGRLMKTFAIGPNKLLAWRGPPGNHRYTLSPGPAQGEQEGAWITIFSLLAAVVTVVRVGKI